jgi:hypothetical protein
LIPLALILAAAGQASSEAPYPAAQVLGAFGDLCRPISDLDAAAKAGVAAGWEAYTPDPASPIGQLLAFGQTEGEKMLDKARGDTMTPMAAFRRKVAGEELIGILSGVRVQGTTVHGCRVYDVGETRALGYDAAEKWIGRAPNRRLEQSGVAAASWEPGFAEGHDSFETFFISSGTPAAALLKVTGISLKADFVGAAH